MQRETGGDQVDVGMAPPDVSSVSTLECLVTG